MYKVNAWKNLTNDRSQRAEFLNIRLVEVNVNPKTVEPNS